MLQSNRIESRNLLLHPTPTFVRFIFKIYNTNSIVIRIEKVFRKINKILLPLQYFYCSKLLPTIFHSVSYTKNNFRIVILALTYSYIFYVLLYSPLAIKISNQMLISYIATVQPLTLLCIAKLKT